MKLLMEKLLRLRLPLIHGFPFKLLSFVTLYFFTNKNPPKFQLKIADFAVHFLLSKLKQLIIHHARLILQAKNQVEMLENDIRLFKAFLKDSAKKRLNNDAVVEFVREIRVVVSEGDYVIVSFVNLAGERRDRDFWKKLGFGGMIKLVGIAKEIGSVRNKVKRIYSAVRRIDFGAIQIRDLPEEAAGTKISLVREDCVIVKKIEGVPVICMHRVGMTALAQTISRNPRIAYDFPICKSRVFLSQGTWSEQEYLGPKQCARIQKEGFLIAFHQGMDTLIAWDEALQVSFLKGKRVTNINIVIATSRGEKLRKFSFGSVCLIVMDDVWYSETCDLLKLSLPDSINAS
ncbi:putative disease resistance protein At1g50180 [Henckelia pumila]|uniref:putative disease resistance protein At1g50180 n=1 Tax=Henckelia pumila TaxID=405737 RepID=UPI003C6E6610